MTRAQANDDTPEGAMLRGVIERDAKARAQKERRRAAQLRPEVIAKKRASTKRHAEIEREIVAWCSGRRGVRCTRNDHHAKSWNGTHGIRTGRRKGQADLLVTIFGRLLNTEVKGSDDADLDRDQEEERRLALEAGEEWVTAHSVEQFVEKAVEMMTAHMAGT